MHKATLKGTGNTKHHSFTDSTNICFPAIRHHYPLSRLLMNPRLIGSGIQPPSLMMTTDWSQACWALNRLAGEINKKTTRMINHPRQLSLPRSFFFFLAAFPSSPAPINTPLPHPSLFTHSRCIPLFSLSLTTYMSGL